jgi:hypothetical protein
MNRPHGHSRAVALQTGPVLNSRNRTQGTNHAGNCRAFVLVLAVPSAVEAAWAGQPRWQLQS